MTEGIYSKMKLAAVPDEVWNNPTITSLDLSNNQLAELPDRIGELTNLTQLNLSGNRLRSLPESLGNLIHLERLYVSLNRLDTVPASIGKLTKLTTLHLDHNRLKAVPEEVSHLSQLSLLELSLNRLEQIPSSLGNLNRLLELHLDGNCLSSLPDSLACLARLRKLFLSENQLTALPDDLSQLQRLIVLDLGSNRLKHLPPSIGSLKSLVGLSVSGNQLVDLPDSIGDLPKLKELVLSGNLLSHLPNSIGCLQGLSELMLGGNQLTELPETIGELQSLTGLSLWGNQLTRLPESVCQLGNLMLLSLKYNELSALPVKLWHLRKLRCLELESTSLTFPPVEVVSNGTRAILSFLKDYSNKHRDRYEVKLMLLGDGGGGKTCLSRALRGLPFAEQTNTKGVEVQSCHVPYQEDSDISVCFRIWDFEGQEINHQSHQFFLTRRSIYVLVTNGRRNIHLPRLDYWLDTIKQRAPGVKVLLVFSECEDREPSLNIADLQARYGELFPERFVFMVGCKNGRGIEALRARLAELVREQGLAPQSWPAAYLEAEVKLQELARDGRAAIDRRDLADVLDTCNISRDHHASAMELLADLGVITHFNDSYALADFIVLQPQWLTKAVSLALESPSLYENQGTMSRDWLYELWRGDYDGNQERFYHCLREFELCYQLEGDESISLVPLRFPGRKPLIPWTLEAGDGIAERRIEYHFTRTPPAGLMSRFIVKTHHYITRTETCPQGVYWCNGVFLNTTGGPLKSEALCEYHPEERWLRFTVRAAFPQNLAEQLHGYIQAVFSFFQGLEPIRYYGCVREDGSHCAGLHKEKMVAVHLQRNRPILCEEGHDVNVSHLVYGFNSFSEGGELAQLLRANEVSIRKVIQEAFKPIGLSIGAIQDRMLDLHLEFEETSREVHALRPEMVQRFQQLLREYVEVLDLRDENRTPALFALTPMEGSVWKPSNWISESYTLHFFCEHEAAPHVWLDWSCSIKEDKAFWQALQPWMRFSARMLKIALPVAKGLADLVLDDAPVKELNEHIKIMEKVSGTLAKVKQSNTALSKDLRFESDEGLRRARRKLAELVAAKDPAAYAAVNYAGLQRVYMPNQHYRWLCPHHAKPYRH